MGDIPNVVCMRNLGNEKTPGMSMDKPHSLIADVVARLGGAAGIGLEVKSDADMARAVAAGFTVKAIDALRRNGVTDREVSTLIITRRTLSNRRASGGRLTLDQSDRAARVARSLASAERAFANQDKAGRWLHRKLSALGGRTPMEMIRTEAGARVVDDLLAKLSWGAAA